MSENPQDKEPKPPFPDQKQAPPGLEAEMTPAPDFGEQSYKGSGKLKGKAAIITGGDSGIGRAVALAFAREGADVLISYLNEEEDAQKTRQIVEKERRKCLTVSGDIGDEGGAAHARHGDGGRARHAPDPGQRRHAGRRRNRHDRAHAGERRAP